MLDIQNYQTLRETIYSLKVDTGQENCCEEISNQLLQGRLSAPVKMWWDEGNFPMTHHLSNPYHKALIHFSHRQGFA